MPSPSPTVADPTLVRLEALEQEIRELRARIAALERAVGTSGAEHPADRTVVQRKAVYDWQ